MIVIHICVWTPVKTQILVTYILISHCCLLHIFLSYRRKATRKESKPVLFDRSLHSPCFVSLETEGSCCSSPSTNPLMASSCYRYDQPFRGQEGAPWVPSLVPAVLCSSSWTCSSAHLCVADALIFKSHALRTSPREQYFLKIIRTGRASKSYMNQISLYYHTLKKDWRDQAAAFSLWSWIIWSQDIVKERSSFDQLNSSLEILSATVWYL